MQKKLKKKKEYFQKINYKKANFVRPGEDFSRHPHFRKNSFFQPYCTLLYCFRQPHFGRAEFN